MTTVVSDNGRTVVPKALREALGIQPGTILDWQAESDGLRVSKAAGARRRIHDLKAFYASVRGTTEWEPSPMPPEPPRQIRL